MTFEEKKCCGFDPFPRKATLLGVFTLAYPLFIIFFLAVPPLLPFGKGERCPARKAAAAARAMLKLINASMFEEFRIKKSALFYGVSPAAAGVFFKYFNFLVITLAWTAVVQILWKTK